MLKKGYTLFVSTSENDADYPNSEYIQAETLSEVRFYQDLLKNFRSENQVGINALSEIVKELQITHCCEHLGLHDVEVLDTFIDQKIGYSEYSFRIVERVDIFFLEKDPVVLV